MIDYLLDSNACIDFLVARSAPLTRRVGESYGRLAVSTITVAELRVGNRTSSDQEGDERILDRFLASIAVMPFDDAAATGYAVIVRWIGVRRGGFDRLIAAHAVSLGLTLVTNNEGDFADIPGLAVENWTR